MYVYVYVCLRICIRIHIHIYIYVHIYSHPQMDGKVNPYYFDDDVLFHLFVDDYTSNIIFIGWISMYYL